MEKKKQHQITKEPCKSKGSYDASLLFRNWVLFWHDSPISWQQNKNKKTKKDKKKRDLFIYYTDMNMHHHTLLVKNRNLQLYNLLHPQSRSHDVRVGISRLLVGILNNQN